MQVEINHKKKIKKPFNTQKLNKTLLNSNWIKEEIMGEKYIP